MDVMSKTDDHAIKTLDGITFHSVPAQNMVLFKFVDKVCATSDATGETLYEVIKRLDLKTLSVSRINKLIGVVKLVSDFPRLLLMKRSLDALVGHTR